MVKMVFGKFAAAESREHPTGRGGVQHIFRFANGYGASVVKFSGSYGYEDGLWELAVIKFDGPGIDDYRLTYTTPITDDVLGRLSERAVAQTLRKIEKLKGEK